MNEMYYGEKYFEWQKAVGEFGGRANLFKFEKYIKENDNVLDFGCGGGYLLNNIKTCGKKIGVEINPIAREQAKDSGIICFKNIKEVEDNSIDVLISNHALEHVDDPILCINEFRRVVKNGGKIVIVVPHEISDELNPCDINKHLFTWSPQNLYNLLIEGKIDVVNCERMYHAWPLGYKEILEKYGWEEFHKACELHAKKNGIYQTIAVGHVLKNENGCDDAIIRSDEGIYKKYFMQKDEKWINIKKIIDAHEKIAIYGAGIAGKKLCIFLQRKGYFPDCFVITANEENKKSINGLGIVSINKMLHKNDYLFIIGVKNPTAKADIKAELKKNGCNAILDFDFDILERE